MSEEIAPTSVPGDPIMYLIQFKYRSRSKARVFLEASIVDMLSRSVRQWIWVVAFTRAATGAAVLVVTESLV